MPIFFQQDIDGSTKLGVWKIEEDEAFFLATVPLQREITHPHKRLQHLAGRYLLKHLFSDFPVELILIADTKKPYLEDEVYHFSISHCGSYAAVVVSKESRVGVDIEIVSQKVERIRHKFVSETEWLTISEGWTESTAQLLNLQTLIWSCKEAGYKWYGQGGVDFREHMTVQHTTIGPDNRCETILLFKKNEALFLNLQSFFFENLCLSYVIT